MRLDRVLDTTLQNEFQPIAATQNSHKFTMQWGIMQKAMEFFELMDRLGYRAVIKVF